MANAPDTSPYILAAPDGNLSNSRVLLAGTGLALQDTGAEGTMTISPVGNLQNLSTFVSPGIMVYDADEITITARTLEAGAGIAISNPGGQSNNPSISVTEGSTIQKVNILNDGVEGATRKTLNLIPSGSVSITVADNSLENRADIIFAGVVAAPSDATYILQTPNVGLPEAQALNALSAGLLKVGDETGVIALAEPNVDYQSASENLTAISEITPDGGSLIIGTGDETKYAEFLTGSTPGLVLTANGAGVLPSWEAPATGNLTVVLPDPTTTQVLAGNTTYIARNSSGGVTTFTLPAVADAVPGEFYKVVGYGGIGWRIEQNATQQISIGPVSSAAGTGGSVSSTLTGEAANDSILIYCVSSTSFVGEVTSGQVDVI